MKIAIVSPALPPSLDGIGDHSSFLATEIARRDDVLILTAQRDSRPLDGVAIKTVFSTREPRSVSAILPAVEAWRPDWMIVQYQPFAYGRWGFNPYLPLVVRTIRKRLPDVRIALMMHEPYVPITCWQFALMTTWQRWQLWMLGRHSNHVFCSIDHWADKFSAWFPGTPVTHLPVGSNIDRLPMTRDEARARLEIAKDTLVVGIFGTVHVSRLLNHPRIVAEEAIKAGRKVVALYIGPNRERVAASLKDIP
ncbi:MAG: hypothetical protein ACLQVD_22355, partial [Capsulimonadaceae bacterium]